MPVISNNAACERFARRDSKRVQRRWLQDVPGYVAQADAQWTARHALAAADRRAD